jgi:hypothetical protein
MPRRTDYRPRTRHPTRDPEYAAILAGLRGERPPEGANPFVHWGAELPRRGSWLWPRVLAVYCSLPPQERRAIRFKRRANRAEREAADAAWLAAWEAEEADANGAPS